MSIAGRSNQLHMSQKKKREREKRNTHALSCMQSFMHIRLTILALYGAVVDERKSDGELKAKTGEGQCRDSKEKQSNGE